MDRLLCIQLLRVLHIEPGHVLSTATKPAVLLSAYLKKSQSSAAASISACHAFFPWPSIVAAISSYRYFPLIRSAALRNTAALSAKGSVSHAGFAARAESIAFDTSEELACGYFATGFAWIAGFG